MRGWAGRGPHPPKQEERGLMFMDPLSAANLGRDAPSCAPHSGTASIQCLCYPQKPLSDYLNSRTAAARSSAQDAQNVWPHGTRATTPSFSWQTQFRTRSYKLVSKASVLKAQGTRLVPSYPKKPHLLKTHATSTWHRNSPEVRAICVAVRRQFGHCILTRLPLL